MSGVEKEPLIDAHTESYVMRSANSILSSDSMKQPLNNQKISINGINKNEDDWKEISMTNHDKRLDHATSDVDTFTHLLKGNIGTGLLALPYATMEAGYILGPIGIFILGVVATHCMIMLVESARDLCLANDVSSLDYAETMYHAMKRNKAWSAVCKIFMITVNVFLMITQFGFCSVYFVFMARSLQQVTTDTYCWEVDYRIWVVVLLVPVIIFSWIRNLDTLASLSGLANICILSGLLIIAYDEISKLIANGPHEAAVKEGQLKSTGPALRLAMFFGTAVFAYEAIGVVLPLENKMKKPEHAKPVIYLGMGSVTILNVIFGLCGYLVYGNNVHGSVTLNLCGSNAATAFIFSVTKVLFAVNIFVSYLIQFYVPLDFLEPHVFRLFRTNFMEYKFPKHSKHFKLFTQLGFRTILVIFTAILAVTIPDLEDLITLVGAGASSCLAFIFPPLIHMLTFGRKRESKWLWIVPWPFWFIKDIVIMLLGIVGFCFGTFAALYSIINSFGKAEAANECDPSEGFQTICHLI